MRKILLVSSLLISARLGLAQNVSFMHGLGLRSLLYVNNDVMTGGTIMYSPRINFGLNPGLSVSLGSRMGLGYRFQSDEYGEVHGSVILDLPLLAELNFGAGATFESESNTGGYISVGYGLHRASFDRYNEWGTQTINGPVFGGGVRFMIRSFGLLEVGASFMQQREMTITDRKLNVSGLSFSYVFGFQ